MNVRCTSFYRTVRRVVVFSFLLSTQLLSAQSNPPHSSADTLFPGNAAFAHTQLYLHIDKSIYVGNEQLWFKAYLLQTAQPVAAHHTLYIFISDRFSNKIVQRGKFVMNDGLAAGNLLLPDTMPAGDYNLFAYTNRFTSEAGAQPFRQQISFRKAQADPFSVTRDNSVKAVYDADSIHLMYRVTNRDNHYAHDAKAIYKIVCDGKIESSRECVINNYGELPVAFKPPHERYELLVEITQGKANYTTRLPVPAPTIRFSFFPESGDLLANVSTRMAFETISASGSATAFSGVLLQDGKPVASLRSNNAGQGMINFKPSAASRYTIQPDDPSVVLQQSDFPPVKADGFIIHAKEGVINDTLSMDVCSATPSSDNIMLFVHNMNEILFRIPLLVSSKKTVKIPAAILPPGLITVTLLNGSQEPAAERTFFNHYHDLTYVTITPDSAEYHTRSKVTLTIAAKNKAGAPLNANLSLASVFGKRIDSLHYQDIIPYALLNESAMQGLIRRPSLYSLGSSEQLETFLYTHCWARYRKADADTSGDFQMAGLPLEIGGHLAIKRKNAKLPVELSVFGEHGINFLTTDSSGRFSIPPEMTALEADKTMDVVVNSRNKEDYEILFEDSAAHVEPFLAARWYHDPVSVGAALPDEERILLANIKTLSTAVVKSRDKNKDDYFSQPYVSNTCNDYFCMNNILNCKNHRFGTPAINGGYYYINGALREYKCANSAQNILLFQLKERYFTKEFHAPDYSTFQSTEPELASTLYWNPEIIIGANGKATVQFYTNDLTGNFTCIAEGITEENAISGRCTIRVVK